MCLEITHPRRHFNGVMRYLSDLLEGLEAAGHRVLVISPDQFKGFYLPRLPEVRISLVTHKQMAPIIEQFSPDYIHIEYEGPIGRAVKKYCHRKAIPYTTCFHSRYDLHLKARFGIPLWISQLVMLRFHKYSSCVMTRTPTMAQFLSQSGLSPVAALKPTVNPAIFYCLAPQKTINRDHPRLIYAGRIAPEKNLEAFLSINYPGEKVLIGDGPYLSYLKKQYPKASYKGYLPPSELVLELNQSDIFVMPSKTETLGRNMLEAMACGLPIAAYPVHGPIDVITPGKSGYLSTDLRLAIEKCLTIPRMAILEASLKFRETNIASEFLKHLAPITPSITLHSGFPILK